MFELMRSLTFDAAAGLATGEAVVPVEHPMLVDHFPGAPTLPGSWLIELAAQVAGPLAEEMIKLRYGLERWAMLGMIREAKFLRPSPLPATLHFAAEALRAEPSNVAIKVAVRNETESVMRAELIMTMLAASTDWAEAIRARHERVARWRTVP
jgi:3-hydroxymyristoyl/3-hydroxydecanoyl-(acyl carrier protein) dehydratase